VMPNAIRQVGITHLECNWLQCHENTGDPAHSVFLHGYNFQYILEKKGHLDERTKDRQMSTLHSRIDMGRGIESLYAHETQYGMEKGINYSKALGADKDRQSRHSTVIFPFFTQTGGPGQVRQEFQIRVPIDDTNTYHIAYGCYTAPNGVEAGEQDSVPYYDIPIFGEDGRPIWDFVLAQDSHAWVSQGDIMDRTEEHLGRTDLPIVFMRRQFEQQMLIVEDGGDPKNVFRDPGSMPDLIHGGIWDENNASVTGAGGAIQNFRSAYHKGYGVDDADRYGPVMPMIIDMMQRIDDHNAALASD